MSTEQTNIHAKVLSQAFSDVNSGAGYGSDQDRDNPVIEYKTEKLRFNKWVCYDQLKKYSLFELRELAFLICTNPHVYWVKEYKVKLAIDFIEKDLLELKNGNGKYYKLLNEHNDLKNKYDKLKSILNE